MKKYIVNGRSMEPALLDGQISFVIDGEKNYYAGQVICFERYGQKVIHRLILKTRILNSDILVEKGDNYSIASWIQNDDVMGRCINVKEKNAEKYKKSKIITMFIFGNICKKMARVLKKINANKCSQFINYIAVFVIPTFIFGEASIKELKKEYEVYRKYMRFEELKKICHKKR